MISHVYSVRRNVWKKSNRPPIRSQRAKFGAFQPQKLRTKTILIEKRRGNVVNPSRGTPGGALVIFDQNANFLRRFVWLVVVVACTGLCLYQVGDRLTRYLRCPIHRRIEIRRNSTVKFPSFTICPYDIDSQPAVQQVQLRYAKISGNKTRRNVWSLLDYANFTSYQIWELNQIDDTNTDVSFQLKKKLPSEDFPTITKIYKRFSFLGLCMTVKITGKVTFMGPAFVLRIEQKHEPNYDLDNDIAFTIFPHNDDVPVLHLAFFKGQLMPKGQLASIALSASTFYKLNTTKTPCQDAVTSALCWTECLERILTSRTTCRLPYMTSTDRNCTTASECQVVFEATLSMYMTSKQLQCNCPQKCVDVNYEINLDVQGQLDNSTLLEIYFKHNNFQQMTEFYGYGFVAFVCDLGGNLGFYLGICLLTVLEMIDRTLIRLGNALLAK